MTPSMKPSKSSIWCTTRFATAKSNRLLGGGNFFSVWEGRGEYIAVNVANSVGEDGERKCRAWVMLDLAEDEDEVEGEEV